ncbi:hypothetical protein [Sphingobium yanoikuyae]|uniref:Uncharacterized protein n=1 Tax=Sphingobium yanoikuyae ATCC 51230 TaxID=883163 RepID=K9D6M3_SPHYA|nr:hypothetical protein [Sphingobium yanoikuyae]EKU74607.1 hypothetical protein HMPREF9718_02135 [Sphingobium yanoikuyae ATCC 51230]WQE06526.1 hypothetical protein U0025_19845 [Sphingobium yanoikuyae]
MKNWDLAIEGISVGAAAAAVGVSAVAMIKFGASQEALLSFMGALIGAATTVAGAAWLADRTARIELHSELQMLIAEYEVLNTKAKTVMQISQDKYDDDSPEFQRSYHDLASSSWECMTITKEALATGRRLSFRHRARLRQSESAIESFWNYYQEHKASPRSDKNGREVYYPGWYVSSVMIASDMALRTFRDGDRQIISQFPIPGSSKGL